MSEKRHPQPPIFPDGFFRYSFQDIFPTLIDHEAPVWTILDRIGDSLCRFFATGAASDVPAELELWERPALGGGTEWVVHAVSGFVVRSPVFLPNIRLYIGANTVIEPTVVIKTPAYIGDDSELRQGAYLRGNVIIGKHCTVGHNTEIKNSILGDHTEAGHFAYIGDSLLGNYVNLGAGTKLANLPFRTLQEKQAEEFPEMEFEFPNTDIRCRRAKIGAVLADGVETGCNSTLSPGTFIGRDSWVYPCLFVRRGMYPPRTLIKEKTRPVAVGRL